MRSGAAYFTEGVGVSPRLDVLLSNQASRG